MGEVGILHPQRVPIEEGLQTGQVGYITCGMKNPLDGGFDLEEQPTLDKTCV